MRRLLEIAEIAEMLLAVVMWVEMMTGTAMVMVAPVIPVTAAVIPVTAAVILAEAVQEERVLMVEEVQGGRKSGV
ncbi:MAG: hypothetical protein WAN50_04515 [Minisyncoccia bacterium]